jgi:lipopolysaccharide export system protein LptA
MGQLKHIIITIFLFTNFCFANIKFSAESLVLNFPSTIVASGNATFSAQNIDITSHQFSYDTAALHATFEKNVTIHYLKSRLKGDAFSLDISKRFILGNGNIIFFTNDITAYADKLTIKNYEILVLKNNVSIEQNGNQIQSNELMYNLKTDTILSNERVKLKIED